MIAHQNLITRWAMTATLCASIGVLSGCGKKPAGADYADETLAPVRTLLGLYEALESSLGKKDLSYADFTSAYAPVKAEHKRLSEDFESFRIPIVQAVMAPMPDLTALDNVWSAAEKGESYLPETEASTWLLFYGLQQFASGSGDEMKLDTAQAVPVLKDFCKGRINSVRSAVKKKTGS